MKARVRRGPGAVLVAALLPALGGAAFAQPGAAQIPQQGGLDLEKGDVSVALDRTAYLSGEPAEISVRLVIEDGWHTNSNQPTYDYLIATEVDLELPPEWPEGAALRYPPGEMKTFSFAPAPISVYEGEVFVRASLAAPAGAAPGTYPIRGPRHLPGVRRQDVPRAGHDAGHGGADGGRRGTGAEPGVLRGGTPVPGRAASRRQRARGEDSSGSYCSASWAG